jgi:amino-acid N-acetyltransferase
MSQEVKVAKAKIAEAPQIHKLVNHFADKGELLPRALSEIYENLREFFVSRNGDKVIASAALHIYWADLAEIRAVTVSEPYQHHGIGKLLIEACLEEARELGLATVFCLTYKPNFFEQFGFHQVDKLDLPRKVWAECYRCPKFPDCDEVALIYQIPQGKNEVTAPPVSF